MALAPNTFSETTAANTPGAAQFVLSDAPYVASAVVIKQLTGPGREIVLTGYCLPMRGLELSVEQRHVKRPTPGGPVAPIQVLGVDYPDTEIEGKWVQEHVAQGVYAHVDGVAVTSIRRLVQIMEQTVAEGQHIKFSWDTQSRVGLLAGFYPKWDRAAICRWSMKLVWQRAAGPDYRPYALSAPNPARSLNWLDTALQGVNSAINAMEGALGAFKTISTTLKKINYLSMRAQEAVRTAAKFIITPVELATEIISTTTAIIGGLKSVLEEVANGAIAAVYKLTVASVRLKDAVLGYQNWNVNAVPPYPPTSSQATAAGAGDAFNRAEQTPYAFASGTQPPKSNLTMPVVNLWPLIGPVQNPAISVPTVPEVVAAETVDTSPPEPTAAETVPDMGPAGPPGGSGGDGASGGIPGGGAATGNPASSAAEPFSQGAGSPIPLSGFATALGVQIDLRLLERQLRSVLNLAAEIRQQTQARITSQLRLKGVWFARANEDLRDVAQHFYQDHRQWRALLVFNELQNSLLSAGQVVLAPENIEQVT